MKAEASAARTLKPAPRRACARSCFEGFGVSPHADPSFPQNDGTSFESNSRPAPFLALSHPVVHCSRLPPQDTHRAPGTADASHHHDRLASSAEGARELWHGRGGPWYQRSWWHAEGLTKPAATTGIPHAEPRTEIVHKSPPPQSPPVCGQRLLCKHPYSGSPNGPAGEVRTARSVRSPSCHGILNDYAQ